MNYLFYFLEQFGLAFGADGPHPFAPPSRSSFRTQNPNRKQKQNTKRRFPLPLRRLQSRSHRLLGVGKRRDEWRPLQVQMSNRASFIAAPGNCEAA